MILVDSSAWIEFFNNPDSQVAAKIDSHLQNEFILIGDLVYCEVLQGIKSKKHRSVVDELFQSLGHAELCGFNIAKAASSNFRALRAKGVTIRKTIDCIIATYCIQTKTPLIHYDRDFLPFEKYLGLTVI